MLRCLRVLTVLVSTLSLSTALAADWPSSPSQEWGLHTEQTIERLAILYLLRARFDVIDPASVGDQLATDASHLLNSGSDPATQVALEEALIAEGSYYITSLRYLIQAGGANWPLDKAGTSYDAANLATLADLQHAWLVAVVDDGDLRSLILAIDQINALTEGYTEVPQELDHFRSLDDLVAEALS